MLPSEGFFTPDTHPLPSLAELGSFLTILCRVAPQNTTSSSPTPLFFIALIRTWRPSVHCLCPSPVLVRVPIQKSGLAAGFLLCALPLEHWCSINICQTERLNASQPHAGSQGLPAPALTGTQPAVEFSSVLSPAECPPLPLVCLPFPVQGTGTQREGERRMGTPVQPAEPLALPPLQ